MAIQCCKWCVPPKRSPYCHGNCPEYIAEKAQYDQRMTEHKKKADIDHAIHSSRGLKVYKALRDHKKF